MGEKDKQRFATRVIHGGQHPDPLTGAVMIPLYATPSGMATASTVLELLESGSHIIAMHDLYGGSYRLFENVRKRSAGNDVSFVDLTDPAALAAAIRPNT